MTSKSRARKFNKKRSNPDDDPYTLRLRKASDAAKAARDAARSRGEGASEDREVGDVREGLKEFSKSISEERIKSIDIGEGARIRSVSLVPEGQGTGYILAVGEHEAASGREGIGRQLLRRGISVGDTLAVTLNSEEGLRQEAASDTASAAPARGAAGAEGQPSAEPESEPQGRTASEGFNNLVEAIQAERARQELNYRSRHRIFFEAEINGVPTHVDTQQCACDIRKDHWVELGEI